LRQGSQPVPVIVVLTGDEDLQDGIDDFTARADDAYWHRFARAPQFSWRRFTSWWIARRWIVPRDPRRR
jgi:hypothetical protein